LQHLLGFELRIFQIFLAFVAALSLSAVAARSEDAFRVFGLGPIPQFQNEAGFMQLRVEQRIIIRVPRDRITPAANLSAGRITSRPIEYREQKIGKCLIMDRFIASRPGTGSKDNLELVTRDAQIIRAYLGNGCLAREFYAGAYMERPDDGKLCVDRDLVYARTGAKCEIDKFRLLVAK
jgi:hypothetical protein